MTIPFVHLHNHSHYSLLDGLSRPEELIKTAREQESPAIALTDHGVMYGAIEFYKAAKQQDIKPIIGCEAYIHPVSRFNRDRNSKYFHLILLAYTNEGYQNLIRLTTLAHLEGFYYKPRIDFELLQEYGRGLIGSSACLQGQIPHALGEGQEDKAYEILKKYQTVFGKENFFLELQHHPNIPLQATVNQKLIALSEATNCPLIITNDAHYINKNDAPAHDVLICIQTQKKVTDHNRLKYLDDFSLRHPSEILQAFPEQETALQNTIEIAQRCNISIKLGQNLMPSFQTPFNKGPSDYLQEICYEGLIKRYGDNPPTTAKNRLEYELKIIQDMGFATYFLIVHDIVAFAKSRNIVVGPGRGSAAGSMVAYSLDITNLDPLQYGLLFERFLNPERISMPDIDIDFADNRRNEILDYVNQKYGKDHVAQIITFGTMAAKAAVRDAGRALGYPYSEVDRIAKMIPPPVLGKHRPLKKSLQTDPDLKQLYEKDPSAQKILDTAIKLEGTIRHAGTHACAVIISKEPIVQYCPIQKAPGQEEDVQITQYSMKPLEEIGLLKMDFLGLKNLTILETTIKLVKQHRDIDIDLNHLPMDDSQTFTLLQNGETTGVFQLESAGMKRYLKDLQPTSFEDIIAMISLYRPGPMEWIPDYINRKHGKKEVKFLHPSLESILKETYAIAIYQEQILEIAQKFAGFSLGEADLLRRAIGKKIAKELASQRKKFIDGAIKKGNPEKLAAEIFEDVIEPFAGYGFNKSHAACYAMISYMTAYLKANFRVEFMAALMTSDSENTDRIVIEINECERLGIKVLPPSINQSWNSFTAIDNHTIRFGLNAIKGLGSQTTESILDERRRQGPFKNLENFLRRLPPKLINKKNIESLVYSGALAEFAETNTVIENLEGILKFAKSSQIPEVTEQIGIFDLLSTDKDEHINLKLRPAAPLSQLEKLTQEKKYLGLYVSGHPLDGLRLYFRKKTHLINRLSKKETGNIVKIGGLVNNLKKILTKNNQSMLYGTIEDPTSSINFIVFPKTYLAYRDVFKEDEILIITGKLEERRGEFQLICQEAKSISLEKIIENAKNEGLFDATDKVIRIKENGVNNQEESGNSPFIIRIPDFIQEKNLLSLKQVLNQNRGENQVEIHILSPDNTKKIRLPYGVNLNSELKNKIRSLIE